MKLTGIHHVTAISADAPGNRRFYVETLGMRLVKKTVNQDDTSAYHLFYADGPPSTGRPRPPAAAPIRSSAPRCASPTRPRSTGGASA